MPLIPNVSRSSVRSAAGPPLIESCEQLASRSTPNFLRLYLNPWIAQVCLCLEHLAAPLLNLPNERCPSFLCNSREEALSGALKLVRYLQSCRSVAGGNQQPTRPPAEDRGLCIIVDDEDTLPDFGVTPLTSGTYGGFIPNIVRCSSDRAEQVLRQYPNAECLVFASQSARSGPIDVSDQSQLLTVRCVSAQAVGSMEAGYRVCPVDVIVFDESFVNYDMPFAAFTTSRSLYRPWMKRGMAMFHSTTFQPCTLSALHFMKCLRQRFPDTIAALREQLSAVICNIAARHDCYRTLYSPSLSKLARITGFDQAEPSAQGHYISVGTRRVFDSVAGVACSIRGHNPEGHTTETEYLLRNNVDLLSALQGELQTWCGLPRFAPAVSGASAVEQALRLALTAQPGRPHVVALQGGFSGKTLLALTGTSKPDYRKHVGPLYPHVSRIDPFSSTVLKDLDRIFSRYPVGVVQLELIQGVGGVRPVPQRVLNHLQHLRGLHDCLLFVDEVQTGMFRTGPFLRSLDLKIAPDLVTIGKGTSDMMFPFAGTLYSHTVERKLEAIHSPLCSQLQHRHDYPHGCATLLNLLRTARRQDWPARIRHQSALFSVKLTEGLCNSRHVHDVRAFGMLIGIELTFRGGTNRRLAGQLARLYSLAMLNHAAHPLLVGFCQYEPNVLKLTPGLLMDDDEISVVSQTIVQTLSQSATSVAVSALRHLLRQQLRRGARMVSTLPYQQATGDSPANELF